MVINVPTEHEEQVAVIEWARLQRAQRPELGLLHAIPNGGERNVVVAARMRSEGVLAGMPDLCLPVARNGWHGLYLELKRTRGGVVSAAQQAIHARLVEQGYRVVVCRGAEAAMAVLREYLGME